MFKNILLVFISLFLVACYSKEPPILTGSVGNVSEPPPELPPDEPIKPPPVYEPTIATMGHATDNEDNLKMYEVMDKNSTYKSSSWTTTTGIHYMVIPISNTIHYHKKSKCRRYRAIATSDDKKLHAYGVACKQEDGTWIDEKNH